MSEDDGTSIGVKMLADHLVKVKLQYEEQINELIQKCKKAETEERETRKKYRILEDELETRRNEIYQMKRESSAQYVIEERENWKAMINQEKKKNEKLQKDLDVARERIKSFQQQLDNTPAGDLSVVEDEGMVTIVDDEEAPFTIEEDEKASTNPIDGPPQPDIVLSFDGLEDSIRTMRLEKKRLQTELEQIRVEITEANRRLEESKQINLKLTDQFLHRVDSLEHDHKERENTLLESIEALKLKLDLELEKKWDLIQSMKTGGDEEGVLSFLWS